MRRFVFILFLVLLPVVNNDAQQREPAVRQPRISAALKADYKHHKKGTPLTVVRVSSEMDLVATIDNQEITIPGKKAARLVELAPVSAESFWFAEYINNNMLAHYKRKGYRHPLRGEVMNDAADYLGSLDGLFYNDRLTNHYVQDVFKEIAPKQLDRKRPERLKLEILKSPNPDAYMLGNGTLMITTGLLSVVDSKDELVAMMTNEIAHYVLDHQVVNIGKERSRVRRARVWGSVLAFSAVALETSISTNNPRYIPGGIMLTASIAGEVINAAAIRKLGMGYSDAQYFEADDIAARYLRMKGMNTAALSSALYKIKTYYQMENDDYALSRKGGYANVDKRLARLEHAESGIDPAFAREMAEVTSFNAIVLYKSENYPAAERLIEKKTRAGTATGDDWLVYVQSRMAHADNTEENERNLELIRRVKNTSDIPNLGIYKQEIVLLLRLKRNAEAVGAIGEYKLMLDDFRREATASDDIDWANAELGWSDKMLGDH